MSGQRSSHMAHQIDESVKIATAQAKTVRAPTRSAIHPLAGIKIASVII